ncbi:MAG: DUF551 domain-containing protein [Pseudomonadota bacterium]|nr:DUF551 domain-containing protein [Pseudomonadota bacterium]
MNWIDCKDSIPDNGELVLMARKEYPTSYWYGPFDRFGWWADEQHMTHWMRPDSNMRNYLKGEQLRLQEELCH